MKLLHVSPSIESKLGGVCQTVFMIISGLDGSDVDNEVVSLDAADSLCIKNNPFPVHALGIGKGLWSYSTYLLACLTDNISRFEDALIAHGFWLYYGHAVRTVMSMLTNARPRLFVMPQQCLVESFRPYKPKREFIVGLGSGQPHGYTTSCGSCFYSKVPGVKGSSYILYLRNS